jgi:hypothetical protein
MPVTTEELEVAIRAAIKVTYVNVEDNLCGCGGKVLHLPALFTQIRRSLELQ